MLINREVRIQKGDRLSTTQLSIGLKYFIDKALPCPYQISISHQYEPPATRETANSIALSQLLLQ